MRSVSRGVVGSNVRSGGANGGIGQGIRQSRMGRHSDRGLYVLQGDLRDSQFRESEKRDDLTAKALRVIGLSDALVSVMSLENAMLSAFGEGDELFVLKAVTGFAVCALTVALGAVMSVSGYTGYKKLLRGEVAVEESENEGSSEDGEDGSEG